MHIEKLDVNFQQMSKHAVADNPIDKKRVDKNSYSLEQKGINESS